MNYLKIILFALIFLAATDLAGQDIYPLEMDNEWTFHAESMWKGNIREMDASFEIYEIEEYGGQIWYHHKMSYFDVFWLAEIDGRYWKKLAMGSDSTLFVDATLALGDSVLSHEHDFVAGVDYRKVQKYLKDTTIAVTAGKFEARLYASYFYDIENYKPAKYEELYLAPKIGIIKWDTYKIRENGRRQMHRKRTLTDYDIAD